MSQDLKVSDYAKYKKALDVYLGSEFADKIIEALGGEETVMNASFATTKDTGLAYEGSFTHAALCITKIATEQNERMPENIKVKKESIVKVGLLSHIAKCVMLTKNTNDWEVKQRGMIYTFKDSPEFGALRTGERSILIAMTNGIKFTEQEYEAMRIMDKTDGDDNYSKYFSGPLSMVVRHANEILTLSSKTA